ncbi:MAG: nitroreductase/quinone reductase family protein [Candidatus Limnocylindria bacterium]
MAVEPPPKGMRGAFIPQGVMRAVTRLALGQFRRGRAARTQGGLETLLLETRGAKSGALRQAVLGFLAEEGGSWLVIASLAGAARNPQWLHNLAARPEATLQLEGGRRVAVRAESLDGQDLEAAWARIAVDAPEYVKYRSKTDREIPVVRLRESV